MSENPLYKKAYFQCARRAILENEVLMKRFTTEIVKDSYSDEKLIRLNELLTKMYDNDMFDLIMGTKSAEDLKDLYDYEICKEIEAYAKELQAKGEAII
ncbi:MAG: succinate dehydrogenase assembly factor 2 [Mucispirillum sp.]|nr:succinate dehydrogenase assembly factor 2 [Mucispirillum sp.]